MVCHFRSESLFIFCFISIKLFLKNNIIMKIFPNEKYTNLIQIFNYLCLFSQRFTLLIILHCRTHCISCYFCIMKYNFQPFFSILQALCGNFFFYFIFQIFCFSVFCVLWISRVQTNIMINCLCKNIIIDIQQKYI